VLALAAALFAETHTTCKLNLTLRIHLGLHRHLQAHQVAAMRQQAHAQQQQYTPSDGGKSVGISVGASMLVASVAGMVNVMLTNPIW
jgi:hypothetical protein